MLKFRIFEDKEKLTTVLRQWPNKPYNQEIYTNKMTFKLQLEKDFHQAMLPVIEVTSKECRELELINIPRWLYKVFRVALKRCKYVNVIVLNQRNMDNCGKGSPKQPLTLLCLKTKLGPTFALCCDASSNFYCNFVLHRTLDKLLNMIKDSPNFKLRSLIDTVCEHFPIKETFEEQYITSNAIRTNNEVVRNVVTYDYSSDAAIDQVNLQIRKDEYEHFISEEQNKTADLTKHALLTNKCFIRKFTMFSEALKSLSKLDEKNPDVLRQDTKLCLKNQLDELNQQSEDYKCHICYTNWINCMFPECKHLQFCQTCIEKNVNQYGMYNCPYCKQFNSFVIVDVDVPKSVKH